MSEKPLFNKSDDQEAIYAPQQLPEDAAGRQASDVDAGRAGNQDAGDSIIVPGAAAGGAGMGGTGPSTGAGTLSGMAPVVGGPALDAQVDDDQDQAQPQA